MDSIFKGKCKTVVTLLSCLVLLIQFATNAFAGVPQVHKANNTKNEEVTPYTTKGDEINALSSMQGISEKEYQLGNTYENPYIELRTINNDKVTKSSEIELLFGGIPDKSIVTKAILKLAKKSGTEGFVWYLSDSTAWYLGSEVSDGQIIEIDVTPSVKAAIEQGLDTILLDLLPFIQDDDSYDSTPNRATASNGYLEFDSTRSSLILNYTSADTYRDHSSVISLGTGQSVDLYTGEMAFSVVDASTNSPAFPVSICHNYSSFFGWIMNYDQSVFVPTNPTNDWALYSDGYGKLHYFSFSDGVLTDVGGLGLIFSFIQDGYQITDKAGNILEFDEDGELVKVMDNSGNYATITRNYYGRISYVTDSFGRSFHFLYNLNTGKMVSVSDPSGRYTTFSYTGDNLTAINYPDGMSISFQYSDGKITQIINPDGTKTRFTYGNNKLRRVSTIPSDSNTAADYVQVTYNSNSTTEVRDRNGLAQVYKLDENGRVVCEYEKQYDEYLQPVRDYLTGTVLFNYTDTKRTFSSSIAAEGDNCIGNGDFSRNSESPWVFYGNKSLYDGMYDGEYVINGSPNKVKYIGQAIDEEDIEVPYGNTMIFSAWAKASSASTGTFRIKAEVWYTNNSHTDSETSFDKNFTDWQYAAAPIKIDRDLTIDHVNVFLEYSNNGGTCYFDDARLVCAPAAESEYETDLTEYLTTFGTSRTVNERVTATDGIYTTVIEKNENGDVIKQTVTDLDGNDFVTLFEYDSCRRLVKTQNYRNMITEYTYNSVGMVTSTKTYYCYTFNPSYDPEPEEYFLNTTAYDQSGVFAVGVGDSRSDSIQTVNVFNTTKGLLTSSTSPNSQTTSYSYNSDNDLVTEVTSALGNDVFSVLYGYDSARRVTSVTHNGFVYGFTYDSLGREKGFSIAGTTFSENSYELSDVTVVTTEYASGESVSVETDSINRTVKNTYTDSDDEDTVVSEAECDDFGNPISFIDNITDTEYTYKYDAYGNAVWEKRNGNMYKHSTFDDHCRLASTSKENETYTLIYDSKAGVIYPDNNLVGMTLSGKYTDRITMDHYGRTVAEEVTLASAQNPLVKKEITYLSVDDHGDTRLTVYPETFRTLVNGTEVSRYSYTYDDNGNITEISSSGNLVIRYVYDGMDRLIREDNSILNASYTYSYDTAGNILEKDKYPYSISTLGTATETKLYTYASTGWKDKLISFDGVSITYDILGNPTSYRGHSLSWGMVRQLETFDQNTFEYNAYGIRVRKNGTVYELDGTTIVEERRTGTVIRYRYGVEGLIGFTYNGTDYYYTKDLLGNITGIYGSDGTKYAAYEYDAWGNHTVALDVSGIGTINPFRYRGYYYDVETGLYYLQTRYYDSVTGRFLNADTIFDPNAGFSSYNLFAYCENNPVGMSDPTGNVSEAEADKLIAKYARAIIAAGEAYGVDPVIIAGCIYAEQVLNLDYEDLGDILCIFGRNTSVGLGQVTIETAYMLEDKGYIRKTEDTWIGPLFFFRRQFVISRLFNNETNILYVAAYLRYLIDDWSDVLDISNMPEILGSLYCRTYVTPHADPESNHFGDYVASVYNHLYEILYGKDGKTK